MQISTEKKKSYLQTLMSLMMNYPNRRNNPENIRESRYPSLSRKLILHTGKNSQSFENALIEWSFLKRQPY